MTRKRVFLIQINEELTFNSDLTLVKMALENLIENACKFRVYDSSSNFVRVEGGKNTDQIEISITIRGEVIPESFKDKIFDIFTVALTLDAIQA